MEFEFFGEVHVAESIAIGEGEVLEIGFGLRNFVERTGDSRSSHCVESRVQYAHAPFFLAEVFAEHGRRSAQRTAVIDHEVILAELIVEEILFDLPRSIARADDEVIETERVVPTHKVDEDRDVADLDHGFGLQVGLFRDTGTIAASQNQNWNILRVHLKCQRLGQAHFDRNGFLKAEMNGSYGKNHRMKSMKQRIGGALEAAKIKGLAHSVLDIARLGRGLVSYAREHGTPNDAYQSMIRLFCNTSGYSSDMLSWSLGKARRPYELQSTSGVLGELDPEAVSRITADLDQKGYHVFERRLSAETCDRLLEFSRRTECAVRPMDREMRDRSRQVRARYDSGAPIAVRYDYLTQDLVEDECVQGLISDASLVSVAQAYLRSAPVLDIVTMWWHTAFSSRPDEEAAQFFHFDMDRLCWLKFFFYLTDVGPENGPHTFVAGSQRRNGIPSALLRKGYARLTDEEVAKHYRKEDFIEFTGPRGTIIAEDTRGLHKGRHVEKGDRLVFQLQFSNSLFGAPHDVVRFKDVRNANLRKMIMHYPRIYSRFTEK